MTWTEFCGFDLETSGVDVETDRIVTAAVVHCSAGRVVRESSWLADPGVVIPAAATAVHGYTTEAARAAGLPADEVVAKVIGALVEACDAGLPLVVMNAPFDLTMLDREAQRHGLKSLFDLVSPVVLDPRVLDRFVEVRRSGTRRLTDLCRRYGVTHGGAHDASADAVAACAVTRAIVSANSVLSESTPREVHDLQIGWAANQQESLRTYFARTAGKTHLAGGVRGDWPLIPRMRPGPPRWGR